MDWTNWKFGLQNINALVVAVVYHGIAFPLLFKMLPKFGYTLANNGRIDGSEVVQVYIKPARTSIEKPKKELKAFKKVFLKASEKQGIEIPIPEESFMYYDVETHEWQLDKGEYIVLIGSSSKDIRQTIMA